MAFVILHTELTPNSWYGGPIVGWTTNLGSALTYATQPLAQAVIDQFDMRALAVASPPGVAGNVVNTGASVTGNVPKYTDTTGLAVSDSSHAPGTIRQVTVLGVGSGTFTPTINQGLLVVECVGGGGGGGGVASPTAGNSGVAGSGCGGGFARKTFTVPLQTFTYVVGAKGTGGAAGNNGGNAGSDSTFTGSLGTTITGSGGSGGFSGQTGNSTAQMNGPGSGSGGAATNGDVNIPGGGAGVSWYFGTNTASAGKGGDSHLGFGAKAQQTTTNNASITGLSGSGHGSGGGGALATGTGAAAAGGDGTDGMIIVTEYQ